MLKLTVLDTSDDIGGALVEAANDVGLNAERFEMSQGLSFDQFERWFNSQEATDYLVVILGNGIDTGVYFSPEWLSRLVSLCRSQGVAVLLQSSIAVVSGTGQKALSESEPAAPATPFGRYCRSAEQQLNTLPRCMILRAGWLYSTESATWLSKWLTSFEKGQTKDLASDQLGNPTSVHDFARVMVAAIEQLNCCTRDHLWQTYHYGSSDSVSVNRFGQTLINEMNLHAQTGSVLDSTPFSEKPTFKEFGQNSQVNCQKILFHFGIKQRAWKQGLVSMLNARYSAEELG